MKGELGWLTHPYGKGVSKTFRAEGGWEGGLHIPGGMEDGSWEQTLQGQPSFKLFTALD